MSEKLKPCPFCGGTVNIANEIPARILNDPEHGFCITCPACELLFGFDCDYGGQFTSENEAINAWNSRYSPNGDNS